MDLTVYCMGDLNIYSDILNAVARTFNSWIFTSGVLAVIGLLVGIFFMILPASMGKGIDPKPFLITLLVFWMGIVPKTSLVIEDVYTSNFTKVDGIPLFVALPASIIASISKGITDEIETQFTTVNATSFLSMGSSGFVNPLKMLLSFRNPGATSRAFPDFTANLTEFVRYCAVTDPAFRRSDMEKSSNVVTYLSGLSVTGIANYIDAANPQGKTIGCPKFQTNLVAYAAALNGALVDPKFKSIVAANEKGSPQTTVADLGNAYNAVTAGMATNLQDSQGFMINAIAYSAVEKGVDCINAPTGPNAATCMSEYITREAQERAMVDAAAQATMFTKMAIPMMNTLTVLFFAFAPIVLAVALMTGSHGIKIMFGLIMFGAWSQSWMPVAAIINYIIQLQVQYAVSQLPQQGITPENMNAFYTIISTKIGTASDMLAMTPMIAMALMSGSMMALSSIANKTAAKDYTDETIAAPKVAQNAPVVSTDSVLHGPKGKQLSNYTGSAAGWQGVEGDSQTIGAVDMKKAAEGKKQHDQQRALTSTADAAKTLDNALAHDKSNTKTDTWQKLTGQGGVLANSEGVEASRKAVESLKLGDDVSQEDKNTLSAAIGLKAMGMGISDEKTLAVMKKHNISTGNLDEAAKTNKVGESFTMSNKREFNKALATAASTKLSETDKVSVQSAIKSQEQAAETFSQSSAISDSIGVGSTRKLLDLGSNLDDISGGESGAQSLIESQVTPDKKDAYKAEYDRIMAEAGRSGESNSRGAKTAARLKALNAVSADGMMNVLKQGGLVSAGARNPEGVDVGSANADLHSRGAAVAKEAEQKGKTTVVKAGKATGVKGGYGAPVALTDGTAKVGEGSVAAAQNGTGSPLGAEATKKHNLSVADIKAQQQFQLQMSNLVDEDGKITGMANVAEAIAQYEKFEHDHPVAAAALSMAVPMGGLVRATRVAAEAKAAVNVAREGVKDATGGLISAGANGSKSMQKVSTLKQELETLSHTPGVGKNSSQYAGKMKELKDAEVEAAKAQEAIKKAEKALRDAENAAKKADSEHVKSAALQTAAQGAMVAVPVADAVAHQNNKGK